MTADNSDDQPGPWQIRDVPQTTRARIKAYAAKNGLTLAQALDKLADLAESINDKE